jgi:ABC-type glycerol-3-phosphate transport system substrate-binding protein
LKKRFLLTLFLIFGLTLAFAACGGGSSGTGGGGGEEGKITSTIETAATSTDPAVCAETQTLQFMEETNSGSGKEAEKECEKQAEADENQPDSVGVSEVEVDGENATADVKFNGGSLDSQTLEIALVEEGGDWKLDEFTGFANFDSAPLINALRDQLEEEASIEPRVTSCIVEGLEELPEEEFEKLVIEQNQQPFVELAESCE